jgi:two-component system chemotaxis response regulator CheY
MSLRILVVDDSKMTRRIISGLVASRWTVCGEAKDGRSGVSEFRKLKPDMVLLDLAMPDIDGIEAGRQMHAIDPTVPLILFTLMDPWGLQSAARTAGISRVVSKSEGWELLKTIEEIATEREVSSRPASRVHQQPKAANQSR